MRLRELVAVGAGVAGAALAHVLDEAGLLPGVHEAASVRSGMTAGNTLLWLALAAGLAGLAARRGPIRIGAPASLLIAGAPEVLGRHDLGAVFEPGAIAGALVQWLLLLAVVAAVVITSRGALVVLTPSYAVIEWPAAAGPRQQARSFVVARRGRPRAPPDLPLSVHIA